MGAVVRNLEEFKADKEIIDGFEAFQNKFSHLKENSDSESSDEF
mgnify:CR=1 FL=1